MCGKFCRTAYLWRFGFFLINKYSALKIPSGIEEEALGGHQGLRDVPEVQIKLA